MKYDETYIRIKSINKTFNSIDVYFEYSDNLKKYIVKNHHKVEYSNFDYDLRHIPDGIAVIPVISNLLPLVWYFDINLYVKDIDVVFYACINDIKKGYERMFPFISFKGNIYFEYLTDYSYVPKNNSISLFSQGIDSINTVINHLDEDLHLLTVHGSDIPLTEVDGWNNLSEKINIFSNLVCCKNSFVKSTFRLYLNNQNLSKSLPDGMKKNWWHQFQHGIAIISHATLLAYLKQSKHIYFASSLSDKSATFDNLDYDRCASSPIIDNCFKFAGCNVIHDGYEYDRLEKLKNIILFSKENFPLSLRVCFSSINGENCSCCDKCSRSILGLISENENPNDYGFYVTDEMLFRIKDYLDDLKEGKENKGWKKQNFRLYFWVEIQKNFIKNNGKFDYDDSVKWILDYDFMEFRKIL